MQQQVRSMVGCLKYLSEGKWSLKDFEKVVKSKQRSKCAPPSPTAWAIFKKYTISYLRPYLLIELKQIENKDKNFFVKLNLLNSLLIFQIQ